MRGRVSVGGTGAGVAGGAGTLGALDFPIVVFWMGCPYYLCILIDMIFLYFLCYHYRLRLAVGGEEATS